eukprot:403352431
MYSYNQQNEILTFYRSNRFVWFSLSDFIVGTSMLILFYKQGILAKKLKKKRIEDELRILFVEQQNKSLMLQFSGKPNQYKWETSYTNESLISLLQMLIQTIQFKLTLLLSQ